MEPEEHTVAKLPKSATVEIRSVAKLIHYLIEGFLFVPYFIRLLFVLGTSAILGVIYTA